ncbi:two-component system C4-dicarboxylate transport response regulator DctD [Sphingomonas kaistensis]|uniref:Two-component system C4-dicarboxylate transport response regulator DctD n=1 Tax=Sphingomonas kaistensis TaxID=298708 RepID=A0A7X5Y8A2_9SPHN|nr:sigma-54 dependent transcriptional regulator [Sphingomonas kaistensis]NJC05725.1 two-component system C4-dicarboxylate transport response regulator DctD [Sphingomonas kaistensis]
MTSPPSVLFAEDDDALRLATTQALELAGFTVQSFERAQSLLASITGAFDGVVVSDIRMPGMDGMELLAAVHSIDRGIPLILVTGHGDVPLAVKALKEGAFDFLSKPFAIDHLTAAVARALDHRRLQIENRRLRAAADINEATDPLTGRSIAMARLRASIRQLAAADVDVLIEGETGVGKEVVAAQIHRFSKRAGRPLIAVNCAAWVDSSFEAELFGHASDSLAHHRSARRGMIAASSGGTLLLDEIDSLPVAMQARLLRVLEEREVQPLGADRPEAVNLRVIATSKTDLQQAAQAGTFRTDLYHRLAATRLRVPPLRERDEDVRLLLDVFVEEAKELFGKPEFVLPVDEAAAMALHDWPGNIRELRNRAFALVLQTGGEAGEQQAAPDNLKLRVALYEAALIKEALQQSGGRVGDAIKRLGLPRKTFYDKATRLGIDIDGFRRPN